MNHVNLRYLWQGFQCWAYVSPGQSIVHKQPKQEVDAQAGDVATKQLSGTAGLKMMAFSAEGDGDSMLGLLQSRLHSGHRPQP